MDYNINIPLFSPEQVAASAALDEARAAATPPPPHVGFAHGCDALGCPFGLSWSPGDAPPPAIRSCSRCGEARYCSESCQRVDWRVSHKLYCGKLRAPPRPLRLMQRIVPTAAINVLLPDLTEVIDAILVMDRPNAWTPAATGSSTPSGKLSTPEATARQSAVLLTGGATVSDMDAKIALLPVPPTRLLLLVPHIWAHAVSGSGQSRPRDWTFFEVSPPTAPAAAPGPPGSLSAGGPAFGRDLLEAAYATMPYMFREEDRLAKGVRYETSTGFPKVGLPCPPRIAHMQGAKVNSDSIVTHAGAHAAFMHGVIMMGPPRWRWATMGPFQIAEMALEDILVSRIHFLHAKKWPPGWYAVIVIHRSVRASRPRCVCGWGKDTSLFALRLTGHGRCPTIK